MCSQKGRSWQCRGGAESREPPLHLSCPALTSLLHWTSVEIVSPKDKAGELVANCRCMLDPEARTVLLPPQMAFC